MPSDQEDPGRSSPKDLVDLIDAFHAMWNAHRIDGILSFFTEDAVITVVGFPRGTSTCYRGKTAIEEMLQAYLPGWQVSARSHIPADTNRVRWMARISADVLRRLGVDWIEWKAEVVLRNGKIAAFTVTLTPDSIAKIDAAIRRCAEVS